MNDTDFKLKITEDVSAIKAKVEIILAHMPDKNIEHTLNSKIKFNRALILTLMTSNIGIVIFFTQYFGAK